MMGSTAVAAVCMFVSLGLAEKLDPGKRANVYIVVVAVFLIISIINFCFILVYYNGNLA